MKVGLFFGSFNPIHIGHLIIANYVVEYADLDNIWFVVSPHNPLKKKHTLLDNYSRLELVNRAIKDRDDFVASSVEFSMPKPSYTIDTLAYLGEKYPKHNFSLIMGSDNLKNIHRWKNFEVLLRYYKLIVYPRPAYDVKDFKHSADISVVSAPMMEISSSLIRRMLKEGKNPQYLLSKPVYKYIEDMHFYKQ